MTAWNLSLGQMFGLVAIAGFIGGVINLFVTENGFILPGKKKVGDNTIFQPGFIGTLVAGTAAATLSWGLEGPAKDVVIARVQETAPAATSSAEITLTIVVLVGAVLIGFGGAKWLSSEVDKRLLKASIVLLARKMTSPDVAARIAGASPSTIADVAASI